MSIANNLQSIDLLQWDEGRLLVNAAFAPWLEQVGLKTARDWMALPAIEIYRAVGERVTSRHLLASGNSTRAVYLKRHGRLTWRERWKALCRLQSPVWGAAPEWNAILEFHKLGIPTMTPVACMEIGGKSCLVTEALENCQRVDHWFRDTRRDIGNPRMSRRRREITRAMARLVQRMHRAGWHHQDLYWCHVLWPAGTDVDQIHLIDLGRVKSHNRWTQGRWILKDLAQLHFSSHDLTSSEKLRFLRHYLGRPLRRGDRFFIRRLLRKSARIARHTFRHGL